MATATSSIDAVMETLYRAVSGPAGEPRDWAALAAIFHPDARLVCLEDGAGGSTVMSLDGYRQSRSGFFARSDFHEIETRRETYRVGPLVQVQSWYLGRRGPDGEELVRGVNALQLFEERGRWRILSVAWFRDGGHVDVLRPST